MLEGSSADDTDVAESEPDGAAAPRQDGATEHIGRVRGREDLQQLAGGEEDPAAEGRLDGQSDEREHVQLGGFGRLGGSESLLQVRRLPPGNSRQAPAAPGTDWTKKGNERME